MKRLTWSVLLTVFGALFLLPLSSEAKTRIYVRVGPPKARVIVVKPAKPYRHAVWVNGHWQYRHGRYVWIKGYWVNPRPGFRYVAAHWQRTPHGYCYVPGHWVRRR